MKPYDYMSDQEIEDVRAYDRLKKAKRTKEATPEMRAAVSKCVSIRKAIRQGRDPEAYEPYGSHDRTTEERLFDFVAKLPVYGGCWYWRGSFNNKGYGQFKVDGKMLLAHRVSYELANGPIPDGRIIRHSCHNPACVNPAHLQVGTQQDNMDDKVRAGRQATLSGEANGRSKLTDSAVREIRDLHAAGRFNQRELGELYGVHRSHISNIMNHRSRKL